MDYIVSAAADAPTADSIHRKPGDQIAMPQYKYRAVPFIGRINENESAGRVAEQLTDEIQKNVYDGWEFYQLSDVNIQVKPGCLSAFLGAKESYIRFDQLIFRKAIDGS